MLEILGIIFLVLLLLFTELGHLLLAIAIWLIVAAVALAFCGAIVLGFLILVAAVA
jgi:hypothetical protein